MAKLNPYRLVFSESEKAQLSSKLSCSGTKETFKFFGWDFYLADSLYAKDESGFIYEYAKPDNVSASILDLIKQGAVISNDIKKLLGIKDGVLPRVNPTPVRMAYSGTLRR